MNCMRFAIPPRQLRLGGWRLGARGARFLRFGVIGGLCGVLGDPLMCLGVPGGSLGVSRGYLGCPWSSWEFVEGPWGVPEKSGTPQGALEIIEKPFVFMVFSPLGSAGASSGLPGGPSGRPWGCLGAPWGYLGGLGASLGGPWDSLGGSLGLLGRSLGVLGVPGRSLEVLRGS